MFAPCLAPLALVLHKINEDKCDEIFNAIYARLDIFDQTLAANSLYHKKISNLFIIIIFFLLHFYSKIV